MTTDHKYQLIDDARETPAYLDTGERAYVYGAQLPFANVAALGDATQYRQYAWETVERILAGPRVFRA